MKLQEVKRFALLLAANDSEYVKEMYGGYFNVFLQSFGDEGETWDLYRVVDDQFPDPEELEKYDGFVISGSPHDAYGNDLWVLKLCFLLQTLDAMEKKLLGICFGHQVLCRALGGNVVKSGTGWDLGVRKITMSIGVLNSKFHQEFGEILPYPSIIECHQDEIWEVPVGAEVIAYSDKTKVESFVIGKHILGIQGHPEYTMDILFEIIDRLANKNVFDREFSEGLKDKAERCEPDRMFWQKFCKWFLKEQ